MILLYLAGYGSVSGRGCVFCAAIAAVVVVVEEIVGKVKNHNGSKK
jgi:hypothetical protein